MLKVQQAGVACVMASYNSVQITDGTDTNAYKDAISEELLTGMVRNTWGFGGFVISDLWAMPPYQTLDLMASSYEGYAQDGVQAGLDMELPWTMNYQYLENVAPPDSRFGGIGSK